MQKNIIFDLGHVLVNFHPNRFLEQRIPLEKREKIRTLIFLGEEWQNLDRGTLTQEEALEKFIQKMPEEEKLLRSVFPQYLSDCLSENQENSKCLARLKQKGYALYILSNFHRDLYEKIRKEWRMFGAFDGEVVSCYYHLMKPEKEIYTTLLEKYALIPEECIFIDDRKENIEAAEKLGIKGIHLPVQTELLEKLAFLWK